VEVGIAVGNPVNGGLVGIAMDGKFVGANVQSSANHALSPYWSITSNPP